MTLTGFTECETCNGDAWLLRGKDGKNRDDLEPCPDCVGGWQPDPAVIEALVADRISRNKGFPPSTFDNLRAEARADLLAYAREVAE